MGFGGFHGDFNNIARASDRRPFPQNLDTNPFMKNHECYSQSKDGGLDLCKKLNEMGISCDKSIWSKPEDFGSRHGWFHNNLPCRIPDGFRNLSSSHGVGVSPVKLRLLASQDYGFEEMMALKNHRDFLAIKRLFEEDRALAAMEGRSYAEDSRLRGVSLGTDALMFEGKTVSRALAAMEASGCSYTKKSTSSLPPNLACMVNIYGSVSLMAKDQIGCRALQKLVEEGTFHDFNAIFRGIINHLIHVSMDQFGNYLVQKMIDLCDEEQRTLILSVLTSKPLDLIQICLNNYGTRVVQKMIESVKTKKQIEMVKSGLEPCCLALVKSLNGNHVIQTCLTSLGPKDNKFVVEVATKYCAEIATHRHGCCLLQCCVANTAGEQRERLVDEISRNALQLSQDPFGNYVVQYIIEQNVPAGKLLTQFRMQYAKLATQKFSSHVVEKCLKHYPESRAEIVRELTSAPNFEYLLQDPFGNYVIQTALSKTKGRVQAKLVEQVNKYGILKSNPYCKKIFSKGALKKK
ncbi:pumilio homolog 9-like [Raphanus sativus]|uniref:Pumilio homolog 9-like n=1 Tax=Raphanus sativus TaxID=3726 RepID=A0A6J0KM52_RAPSA|nr:pumilio homolog 9-like [Raphanus sativus]